MTVIAPDLDRLADLVGIEPFFYDIWGNRFNVSRQTKTAIITALGLACGSDAEIIDSLCLVVQANWQQPLPPVVVLGENDQAHVPVVLFAKDLVRPLNWSLVQEDGILHEGIVQTDQLVIIETTAINGTKLLRCRLPLPSNLPCGYHTLTVNTGSQSGKLSLIIAPDHCLRPQDVAPGGKSWGLSVQLYGLRSASNWGMGDFGDLGKFAEYAAGLGAGMVGLNPIHALYHADPNHHSPYSPSHRAFLNILYIDVVAVPDLAECPEARDLIGGPKFLTALARAREAELVDYPAVADLKRPVMELLFASFNKRHLTDGTSERAREFRMFQTEGGEELAKFALFEALHEHFYGGDPSLWNWQDWPKPYRDPANAEVAAFAESHAGRVTFFQFLQWLADIQLAEAASRGRTAGLRFGFYRDLAVAVNPGGAAAWANQSVIVTAVGVGAPPDHFNLHGQSWGLAPMSPIGLREAAYRPLISVLRANMRHAGVLRIDHVMALQHLYWIPPGGGIGAYVSYPLTDLVRLVALESHRASCVVIGEDLGTVPDGFRPAMQRAGILSCRVFYFERGDGGEFLPPEAYPDGALICATTHDLATLKGFWQGVDLEWRIKLGLYPTPEMREDEVRSREHDRWRLLNALEHAGVLPDRLRHRNGLPGFDDELALAIYCFLAKARSRILMVQIEDAILEAEQPNLPGTVDQHPNWCRRLPMALDQIARLKPIKRLAEAIKATGRATAGITARSTERPTERPTER